MKTVGLEGRPPDEAAGGMRAILSACCGFTSRLTAGNIADEEQLSVAPGLAPPAR